MSQDVASAFVPSLSIGKQGLPLSTSYASETPIGRAPRGGDESGSKELVGRLGPMEGHHRGESFARGFYHFRRGGWVPFDPRMEG